MAEIGKPIEEPERYIEPKVDPVPVKVPAPKPEPVEVPVPS